MDKKAYLALLELPFLELVRLAGNVRKKETPPKVELCNIMNAKSGLCSEDCSFCAQSARHSTSSPVYPLKEKEEMVKAARIAKEIGAERFDIVTSGNDLTKKEVARIAEAVSVITKTVGIKMCASLGRLDEEDLALLKGAGLSRYHHNIETSPGFFPKIVTTHTFQERIDTIKAAKKAGLEVCSGGIIGLGETWDDRIEMALVLKDLDVDSVPINVLVPIKGTPLEHARNISCIDAIKTIALFRIILKDKIIKLAAGRESMMKDFQALALLAGANGMLIGGYLTLHGRAVEDDLALVDEIQRSW